jgi:hypothetical protein
VKFIASMKDGTSAVRESNQQITIIGWKSFREILTTQAVNVREEKKINEYRNDRIRELENASA